MKSLLKITVDQAIRHIEKCDPVRDLDYVACQIAITYLAHADAFDIRPDERLLEALLIAGDTCGVSRHISRDLAQKLKAANLPLPRIHDNAESESEGEAGEDDDDFGSYDLKPRPPEPTETDFEPR